MTDFEQLKDKIPVEMLDDTAELRVERAVLETVRAERLLLTRPLVVEPRPRRLLVASGWAAIGVCAAAVVAFFLWPEVQPPVQTAQETLRPPVIETAGEAARIDLGDAVLNVAPHSRVAVERSAAGGTEIDLAQGGVECEVVPRPAGAPPFAVRAGDVRVAVVGTVFRVDRRGADVQVAVTRGKVQVSASGGEPQFLTAGHQWTAQTGVVAMATPGSALDSPDQKDPLAGRDHHPVAPPGGTRDRPTRTGGGDESRDNRNEESDGDAGTPAPSRPRYQLVATVAPGRGSEPSDLPQRDADALRVMREREVSDPQQAAAWYRSTAEKRRGAIASFALYSVAYLQYFALNQRAEAMRTAADYLKRYPGGPEVEDALLLRVRGLCKNADRDCQHAVDAYLRQFADAPEAAAIKKLRDDE